MSRVYLVPAKPLFPVPGSPEDEQMAESAESKAVWKRRLGYLMGTPLNNAQLSKMPDVKAVADAYGIDGLEGMTMADLCHIQQMLKAMNGDTRAYLALDKVMGQGAPAAKTGADEKAPLEKMVDMLYSATNKAREASADKAHIIEVEIQPRDGSSANRAPDAYAVPPEKDDEDPALKKSQATADKAPKQGLGRD